MHLDQIKSKLSEMYDNFVNYEDFHKISDENDKKSIFLGIADKLIDRPSGSKVHALGGIHSYTKNGVEFINFNLNDAPSFKNKSEVIEWFYLHILEAQENLGK